MVVIFLLAPSVQSVGYLLTSFLGQRKMRYVIVLRGQPFSITHVDHFQAHFLKALLSKLLMKQTVRSQLIDVTVCQWKFGKLLREIWFAKKQRESFNSFCLSLVPLANRYPDNRPRLLLKSDLVNRAKQKKI